MQGFLFYNVHSPLNSCKNFNSILQQNVPCSTALSFVKIKSKQVVVVVPPPHTHLPHSIFCTVRDDEKLVAVCLCMLFRILESCIVLPFLSIVPFPSRKFATNLFIPSTSLYYATALTNSFCFFSMNLF